MPIDCKQPCGLLYAVLAWCEATRFYMRNDVVVTSHPPRLFQSSIDHTQGKELIKRPLFVVTESSAKFV